MKNEQDIWAIVELMGKNRLAGRITEQIIAGRGFVRVEVPDTPAASGYTRYVATTAICALTPVPADVARDAAAQLGEPAVDPALLAGGGAPPRAPRTCPVRVRYLVAGREEQHVVQHPLNGGISARSLLALYPRARGETAAVEVVSWAYLRGAEQTA